MMQIIQLLYEKFVYVVIFDMKFGYKTQRVTYLHLESTEANY